MSFFFFSGNAALSTPPPLPPTFFSYLFVKDDNNNNVWRCMYMYVFIYLLRVCALVASSFLNTTNSVNATFFIRLLSSLALALHGTGLD